MSFLLKDWIKPWGRWLVMALRCAVAATTCTSTAAAVVGACGGTPVHSSHGRPVAAAIRTSTAAASAGGACDGTPVCSSHGRRLLIRSGCAVATHCPVMCSGLLGE